ncbi:MAG: MFS transporter, partial [Proteobacteria bacterium]|nr:MFS transporter [Pseudomonadota bacterium]
MAGLPLVLHTQMGAAIGLVVWGAAAFGIAPSVQMRVMQAASQAPGLASSVNIGAFNLGNALGAALGGLVIDLGLGYAAIPVAGAVLAAAALGVVFLGQGAARRDCVQGI